MSAVEPCRTPVFVSLLQLADGMGQLRPCQLRATWRQDIAEVGTPKVTRPTFRCEAHRLPEGECPQVRGSSHSEKGWTK